MNTARERARDLRVALKAAENAVDGVTMRAILADPDDCNVDDLRALFDARDRYLEIAKKIRKTTLRRDSNDES
jgi:hypothetical protein